MYASLASLAMAFGLKFNMLNAVDALKNYEVPPGRMCLLKGINNSFIIDDTYNSSPFACESALKTLGEIKLKMMGRKIAVLGDMLELGKHTVEAHRAVGKVAKENADVLVVVGPRAREIKIGAMEAGMSSEYIFECDDSRIAGGFVRSMIRKWDMVLVKGSQGVRMERTVEQIMANPENKEKLLVRQDPEWSRR
jgi:UDP-N-acetylmuramoyl-tripeptide--D-alanyl-D-alanine ligase